MLYIAACSNIPLGCVTGYCGGERGLRTEVVLGCCIMQSVVLAIAAMVIMVMVRGVYHRIERWHRSKRFRGAVESLDAVQEALAKLAESKAKPRATRKA
jgi:hypothetical protein